MKLTLAPVGLVTIILLPIIGLVFPTFGMDGLIVEPGKSDLGFNWVENHVDRATPVENSFIGSIEKAGLAPTSYYNFFTIRQVPPVWEKTLAESVPFKTGFFCPMMVIIIFLYFYQSSRNSAGLDDATVLARVSA